MVYYIEAPSDNIFKGDSMTFFGRRGFSLIEILIAVSIFSFMAIAIAQMTNNQVKANNFLEFQLRRTQLHVALLDQVLKNANNCGCIFSGSSEFPESGTSELIGYAAPNALGKYDPANCAGGVLSPLVTTSGLDGLKLTSVKLKNISLVGGTYSGDFITDIESTKDVLGPKSLSLKIPVTITAIPSGSAGKVSFVNCSSGGTIMASGGTVTFVKSAAGQISPTPVLVDIPLGLSSLSVTITAEMYRQLPADYGETIGADFYATFSPSTGVQTKFANLSVGSGNNNGGQARVAASVTGVLAVPAGATQVTFTRRNYVLKSDGSSKCSDDSPDLDIGTCSINYNQNQTLLIGF